MRTAIDIQENRVFLALVHIRRGNHAAPQRVALLVHDGEDFRVAELHHAEGTLRGEQRLDCFTVVIDQRDDSRGGRVAEIVNEIGLLL